MNFGKLKISNLLKSLNRLEIINKLKTYNKLIEIKHLKIYNKLNKFKFLRFHKIEVLSISKNKYTEHAQYVKQTYVRLIAQKIEHFACSITSLCLMRFVMLSFLHFQDIAYLFCDSIIACRLYNVEHNLQLFSREGDLSCGRFNVLFDVVGSCVACSLFI